MTHEYEMYSVGNIVNNLWFPEARYGGGELDEGSQKVQTFSCKINKY